ncbi:GNAT family N-acetyltransferase [Chromobacterium sp. IIBBL 290-4]|uniref:GNAT family N-acetyltransferase n=1 Tax=Chromobacterium sp. IIBBL 290-4 TaxID=2953890 RepID=UPI0020B78610|nr:GNAT family N-acetyltransferase [Chromobacterium sp. IIBBL 290-4]UTH76055.1 GNAT family N-acetyltransferase [Chromobacterium sp. IIBBL 290-4]
MDPIISLRMPTPQDADLLASLHVASWQSAYRGILPDAYLDEIAPGERLAMWKDRLAQHASSWTRIAYLAGRPAGFACLLPDTEPARGVYLDNLHVLPEFKGHGIGRLLLAAAAAECLRIAPGRPLFLWTFAANQSACRFYQALGGTVTEQKDTLTPAGNPQPALCFQWDDPAALTS